MRTFERLESRFQFTGELDILYGRMGISGALTPTNTAPTEINAITTLPDGRAYVAGGAYAGSATMSVLLARLDYDGKADPTFGANGVVITSKIRSTTAESAVAMVVQPDGKIVIATTGGTTTGHLRDFYLHRYTTTGALDASFGAGGRARVDFATTEDRPNDLLLQPDGKLVVVGSWHNGSTGGAAMARFDSAGALDPTFGTGGKVTFTSTGELRSALLVADGKILASASSANQTPTLARFLSNGQPDPSFGTNGIAHPTDTVPSLRDIVP